MDMTTKVKSDTSFWVNACALIVGVLFLVLCRFYGYKEFNVEFIFFAIITTIATVLLEKYVLKKETFQIRILRKLSWKRLFYKETTLLVTFGFIWGLYALFPMFEYNDFKLIYFPFLKILVPWILVGSIPYFILMDKIEKDPEDIYYKLGKAIHQFQKTVSQFEFANYVRSWLVKAFWLSLMQPFMIEKIRWLINYNWDIMKDNPVEWFWTANVICFLIDLAYASVGYLMNLKIIHTETKTAEPTLLGWVTAIMCYWPFWGVLFYNYFFRYNGSQKWLTTFETGSFIWYIWFIVIITLEFLYAMATISAGIRFSNLTYRGLWNTGPYRWTKHPAYVFKNISWWFISMPFLAQGWTTAVKCSFLLLGVNIIYYLRARTEERHLSHYPEYEAYALEMNQKSIFKGVAKILPFLKYKPLPKNKRLF